MGSAHETETLYGNSRLKERETLSQGKDSMDPRHLFIDERLTGACVYCGGSPDTRDHVPSKVFLDEPYPPQLPVVAACNKCNSDFSKHEQYFSCFLECVICGSTDAAKLHRPKIKRVLDKNPKLRSQIEAAKVENDAGRLMWQPEIERIEKIILKLARSHAAYELYPKLEEPVEVTLAPLTELPDQDKEVFEDVRIGTIDLLPEIGSRAFHRALGKGPDQFLKDGWIVVQPGRYRYFVTETEGLLVKLVLSEYLACMVSWE